MNLPLDFILAQLNPTTGDLKGNLNKIRAVRDANKDSDLIIFSEMIMTGYPIDDLVLKPSFMENVETHIQTLVSESKNHKAQLLIGTPLRQNGKIFNAALVIGDGEIKHIVIKHRLPNDGVFDEKRYFSYGNAMSNIYKLNGVKLGIMICEDMWHKDMSAHLKSQGADILIIPNGSPFQSDIVERREHEARTRISETSLPLIYVNQIGGQDDLVFDGQSFVMDKDGNKIIQLPAFEKSNTSTNETKLIAPLPKEEIFYKAVTLGLKDYVQKNGFKGVLIGLSGGIDSALSAAIAVDAIGAENVHCVMMPSPYTSQDSLDDAAECAKLLGVKLDTIQISDGMTALDNMLADHTDKQSGSTTFENIQSRLRGMTLMALSNESGKMVLSTGNKSEMAVGYATLYGDMCGGYNALKDLYKGEVYALSEWRNTQGLVIPTRIITKAPSAELKPDQTDQDTLPPYDVLDDILECLIEREMGVDDIPHDHDTVLKIWGMLDRNEYKRRQSPPGPKITTKAFGRDRRYPITNGFFKTKTKT